MNTLEEILFKQEKKVNISAAKILLLTAFVSALLFLKYLTETEMFLGKSYAICLVVIFVGVQLFISSYIFAKKGEGKELKYFVLFAFLLVSIVYSLGARTTIPFMCILVLLYSIRYYNPKYTTLCGIISTVSVCLIKLMIVPIGIENNALNMNYVTLTETKNITMKSGFSGVHNAITNSGVMDINPAYREALFEIATPFFVFFVASYMLTMVAQYFRDSTEERVKKERELTNALQRVIKSEGEKTRTLHMIKSISCEYSSLWHINSENLKMTLIHSDEKQDTKELIHLMQQLDTYEDALNAYICKYVSKKDRQRVYHEASAKNVLKNIEKDGNYTVNHSKIMEDGSESFFQMVYGRVDGEDGKNDFVIGFRDVDEAVKKEMQQKQAIENAFLATKEANEVKAMYMEHMSKDVTMVMNDIMGMTALAQAHAEDGERLKEDLDNIATSSKRLLLLTNDLLNAKEM